MSTFQLPYSLEVFRSATFSMQNYCGKDERQGPLALFVGGKIRQPSTIFRASKLGIPDFSSDFTLVLSSFLPQGEKHVKRLSRPRSSKELYKREKESGFQFKQLMRVKRMTIKQGKEAQLSRFPNFHSTGSVAGMKKLYYGQNCLLVKCGDYIYNVSSEPEIYNQAK